MSRIVITLSTRRRDIEIYIGCSNYACLCCQGLINTFQLSSTWLTVNMALGRYIAICHPLHARGYIRPRGTRIAVLVILLASGVFNAPRFLHYRPVLIPCHWLVNSSAYQLVSLPVCDCFYHAWVKQHQPSHEPIHTRDDCVCLYLPVTQLCPNDRTETHMCIF